MTTPTSPVKAGKILDTLGAMQSSMTRVGKSIAQYVIASPHKVTQLSIADLSEEVNAGEASVIRFCRQLGYKGFQNFKMELAIELAMKLMRIGLRVDALTNNHFMYMQAALLKVGDVAIGISHSGHSPETAHALDLARQAGATTVALTHNLGSPLSKVADITLINGNRQGRLQGDSIGTKTAQLFVLDLIYTLLVQRDPEAARANKLRTMDALSMLK